MTTLSLNKILPDKYATGEKMTLTITSAPGDRATFEDVPGRVTVDPDAGGPIQPATVDYVAKRPTGTPSPLAVTDPDRAWVKVSDDGTVAVYTSTA